MKTEMSILWSVFINLEQAAGSIEKFVFFSEVNEQYSKIAIIVTHKSSQYLEQSNVREYILHCSPAQYQSLVISKLTKAKEVKGLTQRFL